MFRNCSSQQRTRFRGAGADARGFTLVEMLVATTLTVIVLGSISLVFLLSNQSVKRMYQQQEGYDMARGSFNILELDLTTAFAAREFGDHYKFFGTPIGFMYVGLTNTSTRADADQRPNISRVTYAVYYGDPANPGSGVFTNPEYPGLPPRGSGTFVLEGRAADDRVNQFTSNPNLQSYDPDISGYFEQIGEPVVTYSLLRYVENGQGDLDSYPPIVDGNGNALPLWETLAASPEETSEQLRQLLADACNCNYPNYTERQLSPERRVLLDARKRELWIRMLSGDPRLPNLWRIWDQQDDGEVNQSITPRDFIVAEQIYLPSNLVPLIPPWYEYATGTQRETDYVPQEHFFPSQVPEDERENWAFFRYGRTFRSQVLTGAADAAGNPVPVRDFLGNPMEVRNERFPMYWNAYYNIDRTGNFRVTPEEIAGNVRRVATRNGRTVILERDTTAYNNEQIPGTPLDPRLPEAVSVRFEIMVRSNFTGVPEFNRMFDQVIDLPSGYARKEAPT